MANELQESFQTGYSCKFNLVQGGQWLNNSSHTLENFNAANTANYNIAASEISTTGVFVGTVPSGTPAGTYLQLFLLVGTAGTATGFPAIDARYPLCWDGAEEVTNLDLQGSNSSATLTNILAATGGGGGGFTGSSMVTLVFLNADSSPAGNTVFTVFGTGTKATDPTGIITVGLNDGTNIVLASPSQTTFWQPDTINVSGDGTFTLTGAAAPAYSASAFTLTDLRNWSRQFTRNAQDSTMYNNTQIDRAIQLSADEWLRITKATRRLDSVTLTAGSSIVPTLPTNWKPEFKMGFMLSLAGQIVNPNINFVDITDLETFNFLNASSSTMQQPCMIAFTTNSPSSGIVGIGVPDKAYTLGAWWWEPFTAWRPGAMGQWSSANTYQAGDLVSLPTANSNIYQSAISNNTSNATTSSWSIIATGTLADPNTLTFNLPNDHLRVIATWGVRAEIQQAEPENLKLAETALDKFTKEAARFKGRGSGMRGGDTSISPGLPNPNSAYGSYFPAVPPPMLS